VKTGVTLPKSSRTRQFIIERSAVLFNKKGISGTSISDIIEVTGLTKGSIYGNFKDKDEVAIAAFEYNVSNMLDKLYEGLNASHTSIDKLLQYPKHFRQECHRLFEDGGCAILNTAIEADDAHPELKSLVAHTIRKWESNLVKIISEGIEKEDIRSEIDPEKYATLFIGSFEGGVMLSKVTGDMKYLFNALEHLESIVINELKR
jgi:TetR/AcrR family transcriptional regulator, transcriptional repressor for nem operon